MEKVGLITIHNTVNFGSLLQTYSTYKALKQMGCNVKLIDYRCDKIEKREAVPTLQGNWSIKGILRYLLWHKALQQKHDCFWKFMNENMSITDITYTTATIAKTNDEFDTFLVGSDIVWGTNITGNDMTFFLDFASEDKRKLAFSSSVGTKWTQEERREIEKMLQRFEAVSVREQMAAEWVRECGYERCYVTCDPTMLWDVRFWSGMMDMSIVPNEVYVLIYLVNPDQKNIIDGIKYARSCGCKAYFINFFRPFKGTVTIRPTTIQQWIALVANAKAVFTASYHGLLFSLYFHREVFYYNRGEKSRMISMGEELQILHREGTDDNLCRNEPVNYSYVDSVLEKKRQESWVYLMSLFDKRG